MRLVSPDRLLLDATAVSVELPSSAGYLETLYGAACAVRPESEITEDPGRNVRARLGR